MCFFPIYDIHCRQIKLTFHPHYAFCRTVSDLYIKIFYTFDFHQLFPDFFRFIRLTAFFQISFFIRNFQLFTTTKITMFQPCRSDFRHFQTVLFKMFFYFLKIDIDKMPFQHFSLIFLCLFNELLCGISIHKHSAFRKDRLVIGKQNIIQIFFISFNKFRNPCFFHLAVFPVLFCAQSQRLIGNLFLCFL